MQWRASFCQDEHLHLIAIIFLVMGASMGALMANGWLDGINPLAAMMASLAR